MSTTLVDSNHASDMGAYISSRFESGGPGARVLLRPGSVYRLTSPIYFAHDDQQLATAGLPDSDSLKSVLKTVGDTAQAVAAVQHSNILISHLVVDGCEPELGTTKDREPLVFLSGNDNCIQHCVLRHPRGWTSCHVFDGSCRSRVLNNQIGPSGHPAPRGPWADGLSIACRDGLVAGNTIVDATDGGIVLFCAPGTLVTANTIIARSRDLLGAINMVDASPYDADYTNTRVIGNRIISDGAYIKLGIGIGPLAWGDWEAIGAIGGTVENNTLVQGEFGYGFAVAGCKRFVARDLSAAVLSASHTRLPQVRNNCVASKVVFTGDTANCPWNPAPAAFVRHHANHLVDDCDLQDDFCPAVVRYLIGIQPGLSSRLVFYPGSFRLDEHKRDILLQKARLTLTDRGTLEVVDHRGKSLWQSPLGNNVQGTWMAEFDASCRLAVSKDGAISWTPVPRLDLETDTGGIGQMTVQDVEPYIQVYDKHANLLFSSSYLFGIDWCLLQGQYVAIPPVTDANVDTPVVTWLYLDSHSGILFLHTSSLPISIEADQVHWQSPNWKQLDTSVEHEVKAVLQGDGNLVIYADGEAVWATGTGHATSLTLTGASRDQPARMTLLKEGQFVWSS